MVQHFYPHENRFNWVLMYLNFFLIHRPDLFKSHFLIVVVSLSIFWNLEVLQAKTDKKLLTGRTVDGETGPFPSFNKPYDPWGRRLSPVSVEIRG